MTGNYVFPTLAITLIFLMGVLANIKLCKILQLMPPQAWLQRKWMFFTTSHEKHPCDGIGSPVKQLISSASLQCVNNSQIIKFSIHMACFNTTETTFKVLNSSLSQKMIKKTITFPDSRSYHEFIPLCENAIAMKNYS